MKKLGLLLWSFHESGLGHRVIWTSGYNGMMRRTEDLCFRRPCNRKALKTRQLPSIVQTTKVKTLFSFWLYGYPQWVSYRIQPKGMIQPCWYCLSETLEYLIHLFCIIAQGFQIITYADDLTQVSLPFRYPKETCCGLKSKLTSKALETSN